MFQDKDLQYKAVLIIVCLVCAAWHPAFAEEKPVSGKESAAEKPQRLLLIGQGPDGHPNGTHEWMAEVNLLAKLLGKTPSLQTIVVKADGKWPEGPELLDSADAAVLCVAQGALWLQQDKDRLNAFQRLAARRGGLSTFHWAMGAKDAKYIDEFAQLFGGCHGGPDRKFKVLKVLAQVVDHGHPILRGIAPFEVEDEFYYALKVPQRAERIKPLIQVSIDGKNETVGWAWERPDGGRSFGFSGCHFHRNWELTEYRRLAAQGILWTLGRTLPNDGMNVDISPADLKLSPGRNEQRLMIFIIDNYDSFTYNLVQRLGEIDKKLDIRVARNDQTSIQEIESLKPDRIIVSPGPCTPREAGISKDVIAHFGPKVPLLGVCLGHQAIAEVYGAEVVRADRLMHGKVSQIHHDRCGVFANLKTPFTATRYHSLVVPEQSLPDDLELAAWTADSDHAKEVMGFRHRKYPVHGVQFHPESFLTSEGIQLLINFLKIQK